jgi:transposase-like protein
MKRKYRKPEQIIQLIRQAEAKSAQGQNTGDICRQLGISDATYYNWRKQYGGMGTDEVKRLKELQKENSRLKKLVADQALDIDILKETLRGNY